MGSSTLRGRCFVLSWGSTSMALGLSTFNVLVRGFYGLSKVFRPCVVYSGMGAVEPSASTLQGRFNRSIWRPCLALDLDFFVQRVQWFSLFFIVQY